MFIFQKETKDDQGTSPNLNGQKREGKRLGTVHGFVHVWNVKKWEEGHIY